ncbi:hypothetical protein SAMN04487765_0999 [Tenacibaculum sp. MAR_2010_89]|nr:hypothetical protein SAMN04487765_0999 [Tenacibaculum sp. MAR_2010_89]
MGKTLVKKANDAFVGFMSALAELGKGASYALKH